MKAMKCPNRGEEKNWHLRGEISSGDNYMIEEVECFTCGITWENEYHLAMQRVKKT